MGAIEHAQPRELEGRDLGNHLGADRVPARPSGGEAVLDRPLPEGLADHRGSIILTEEARHLGDIGLGSRRHDAVDHGRGKGAIGLDPGCELVVVRRGEVAGRGRPGHGRWRAGCRSRAVKGAETRFLAGGEDRRRSGRWPRRGAPGLTRSWTMSDEPAGGRIVAIALLGDGERDDSGLRRDELRHQRLRALGRDQDVEDRADDAQLRPGRGPLQEGVEPVLGFQPVTLVGPLQAGAGDAPGAESLSSASSVNSQRWARAKAPSPRWTMPGVSAARS